MDEPSFHNDHEVAEFSPAMLWLGDAEGKCIYLNRAMRRFWGVTSEDLTGFDWSSMLHPDDIDHLRRPFEVGMRKREAFEVTARYFRHDGELRYLHTSAHPRFDPATGAFVGMTGVNVDITDLVVAERTVAENERRKDAMLNSALDSVVTIDHAGRFIEFNRAAEQMFGLRREEVIGSPMEAHIVPMELRARHRAGFARFLSTREGRILDTRLELPALHADGRQFPVEIAIVRVSDAEPPMFTAYIRDISERKASEARTHHLIGELNHRTKNILSVVQAVAAQTSKNSTPEAFMNTFQTRLAALAASNDLLVSSNWSGVRLAEMVPTQLQHLGDIVGDRVVFSGPPVTVLPGAAQTLGMALHELSTNSIKHGALSNASGRVRLSWNTAAGAPERRLVMSWSEEGGPPVSPPAGRGFGSVVIDDMIASALGAEVKISYETHGFRWSMDAPAARVMEI